MLRGYQKMAEQELFTRVNVLTVLTLYMRMGKRSRVRKKSENVDDFQ